MGPASVQLGNHNVQSSVIVSERGVIVQSPPPPKFCQVVHHPVQSVKVPFSLVIISQGWPCWLSSVSSLRLPVAGGYFPAPLHHYFPALPSWSMPKLMTSWSEPKDFLDYTENARALPSSVCLLLSGPIKFCRQLLPRLREHPGPFMFAIDQPFETFRQYKTLRNQREIVALCNNETFQYAVMNHSDFGGATNASHIVIFRGLAPGGFHPPPCMPRVLKHLLISATPGRFVEIDEPASLQGPVARAPIYINGLLRREGLLDVHQPRRLVACPSVFSKSGWVSRHLNRSELLRAFDVPVAMDDLFSWTANSEVMLPCGIQHTISPLVVTSIFRSLWDNSGGG